MDKKAERQAFDESEANCNTCKHLQRVQAPKCKFGFLTGHCAVIWNPWLRSPQIFRNNDSQNFRFHPNDPMHMSCYEPRWRSHT